MFSKFQILKKALKRAKTLKTLKKSEKKIKYFFVWTLLHGKEKCLFKNCLFYPKFFESEVKTFAPFFWGSI